MVAITRSLLSRPSTELIVQRLGLAVHRDGRTGPAIVRARAAVDAVGRMPSAAPGVICTRLMKLRPFSGRSCTACEVTLLPMEEASVCSTGAVRSRSRWSGLAAPTTRLTSSRRRSPAEMVTFETFDVWKPGHFDGDRVGSRDELRHGISAGIRWCEPRSRRSSQCW